MSLFFATLGNHQRSIWYRARLPTTANDISDCLWWFIRSSVHLSIFFFISTLSTCRNGLISGILVQASTEDNMTSQSLSVACKTLKAGASRQMRVDFAAEVKAVSLFKHEHVISLLGIVLDGLFIARRILLKFDHPAINSFFVLFRSVRSHNCIGTHGIWRSV